jgi:tetratricopeptide (TPR) repeat protein
MSEATVNTIAEANAEMYDRLLVSIEAGTGLLQIFIAVCDADRQREQIIAEYERELAPNIHHYRVNLDRQEPSLRHAVASIVTTKKNAVVTVLGAEVLGLSGQVDESLDKFFGYLQWTREALREFPMPIVLWIPSRIFKQLAKRSPDFWSWRNGVFQFQLEPSLVTTESPDVLANNLERASAPPKGGREDRLNSVLSIEQLEASLAKAIAKWGTDSSNVVTLYSQLGDLYSDRVRSGKSAEREREFTLAQDYFKRAISLQTKFEQQEALARSLNELAFLYKSTGRYAEAEPLYLRSLAIREQELGANHPDTATSLNNLASLYESTGRYAAAEPLYLRSLAISEKELGANHPDTAGSLNNLAGLYRSTARYAEAEPLFVRSLAISEKEVGANHPSTATSLNNLAGLYKSTARYAEAEPLYVRSLAIRDEQLGANHPDTAASLNNLAGLYESTGRYAEAEPLFVRSLTIKEQELGANHPSTATSLNNLAGLYYSTGRYAEAEPLYVRTLEILEQSLGTNHPNTQTCIQNLQILRQQLAPPQQQPEQPRLNWWQRLRGKLR